MKKNIFIVLGFSSALLFSAGNILPAAADSSTTLRYGGRVVATARFVSRDDIFYINDKATDGKGAYVEFYIPSTGRREKDTCKDVNGANNGETPCDLNFRERRAIYWRLSIRTNFWSTPTAQTSWILDSTSR